MIADLRALPRAFWILFAGIFINRFGTFVWPFLTIYLTRQGYSLTAASFAVSAFAVGSLCGGLTGGWLADHIGRRNTIVLGNVPVRAVVHAALCRGDTAHDRRLHLSRRAHQRHLSPGDRRAAGRHRPGRPARPRLRGHPRWPRMPASRAARRPAACSRTTRSSGSLPATRSPPRSTGASRCSGCRTVCATHARNPRPGARRSSTSRTTAPFKALWISALPRRARIRAVRFHVFAPCHPQWPYTSTRSVSTSGPRPCTGCSSAGTAHSSCSPNCR